MENQSTTPSSMQFLLLEQVQFLKVNDDSLFQWELVDVVEAEEEDEQEERRDDGFDSWGSSPNDAPIEGIRHLLLHRDVGVEDQDHHPRYHREDVDDGDADGYGDDDGDGDGDDEDDDDDGYGLDDELVPWNVSDKFERQRMRKLGKRAFSKMHNSKRCPYLFVRPGCVRGKHGLGLKHSY
ncbi:histone chaperone RTT106-like [Abrus precatorius]|uniref:Histone chaperone RTT106-like n=1 Tax=Abrus precatorius TaxID=3816 RepID=A0A8B8LM59_ABRPR|nr:histone chaperone RTT106-like [Abrus precatorius]